jgi:hypothetical protein
MNLWLIARSDGAEAQVVRSASRETLGVSLSQFGQGVWCIWRLGNFPEQYEVKEMAVRALGRTHIQERVT